MFSIIKLPLKNVSNLKRAKSSPMGKLGCKTTHTLSEQNHTIKCLQAYLFGIPSLRLTRERIENRLCICLMNAGGTVVVTGGVVGNPCFTAIC